MSPAATRSSSRAVREARMPPLRRLQAPAPRPVFRLRLNFRQRTSLSNTLSIKAEFHQKRYSRFSPRKLGEGAGGKVSVIHERVSHQPYAVKEVFKNASEAEEEYMDRVYDEFDIASLLRHPNVVKTFRVRTLRARWCVVMEHCPNGDVFDGVSQMRLTEEEELCLFKQLLHAVEYMHQRGVAHRDIKIENLLLNGVGHLKIADFGHSTLGNPSYGANALSRCTGYPTTPVITPPEVMAEEPFHDGRAFDVWSCAMTLLSMLWLDYGVRERSESSAAEYERHLKSWRLHMGRHYYYDTLNEEAQAYGALIFVIPDARLQRLLLGMLHPEPAKRLTISQALDDPYVRSIPCCFLVPNSRDQGPPAQHYHGPPRSVRCQLRLRLNFLRRKMPGRD